MGISRLLFGDRITYQREARNNAPAIGTSSPQRALIKGAIVVAGLSAGLATVISISFIWRQGSGGWPVISIPLLLVALFPAATSYFLRLLRWHFLLQRVAGNVPLLSSLRIQSTGFALGTTPGRIGEALKFYLVERVCAVSAVRAGPVLIIERLSDAIGLATIAFLGIILAAHDAFTAGFLLHDVAIPIGLLVLVVIVAMRSQWISSILSNRLRRWGPMLAEFFSANRRLLLSIALPQAIGLTLIARLCDALTVYITASALGLSISYPQASVLLGTAGVAGGISLLPGGLGASETVMVGLLVGFGASASVALSITFLARLFTYWLWVAIGFASLPSMLHRFTKGTEDAYLPGIHPS